MPVSTPPDSPLRKLADHSILSRHDLLKARSVRRQSELERAGGALRLPRRG